MSAPKITCPDCEGMGEWDELLPARSSHQEEPEYEQIKCDRCGGEGSLEKPDACDDCGECEEDGQSFNSMVEAMETFDKLLCDSCFDNRCENAWVESQSGEPPVSLDEQHRAAWQQKQELRR